MSINFDYQDAQYGGIVLDGAISPSGDDLVVAFDRFEVSGNDLGTPTLTFAPFAE